APVVHHLHDRRRVHRPDAELPQLGSEHGARQAVRPRVVAPGAAQAPPPKVQPVALSFAADSRAANWTTLGVAMRARPLLVGCALLLVPCPTEETYTKAPIAVRVRTLEQKAAGGATRYSANVEPFSRVDLAFKVGGYVREIAQVKGVDPTPRLIQEGDT